MFSPKETKKGKIHGTLHMAVKQARDLPKMDDSGLADGFVKCYLLPDKSSAGKRKTGVVKNNLNPVWGEQFHYEKVVLDELSSERVLEVTVWDWDRGSSNDFIGGLRLGPAPGRTTKRKEWMDSIGDEVSHWEAALAHPGEWVEQWHTLRPSMDPRSIDLSAPPKPSPLPTTEELHEKEAPVEDLFGAKVSIGTHKASLAGSEKSAIDDLRESLPRSSPVLTKKVSSHGRSPVLCVTLTPTSSSAVRTSAAEEALTRGRVPPTLSCAADGSATTVSAKPSQGGPACWLCGRCEVSCPLCWRACSHTCAPVSAQPSQGGPACWLCGRCEVSCALCWRASRHTCAPVSSRAGGSCYHTRVTS